MAKEKLTEQSMHNETKNKLQRVQKKVTNFQKRDESINVMRRECNDAKLEKEVMEADRNRALKRYLRILNDTLL